MEDEYVEVHVWQQYLDDQPISYSPDTSRSWAVSLEYESGDYELAPVIGWSNFYHSDNCELRVGAVVFYRGHPHLAHAIGYNNLNSSDGSVKDYHLVFCDQEDWTEIAQDRAR